MNDAGTADQIEGVANSFTSAKLNIESVQASAPLLVLSTGKDVVIKVSHSLADASGTRESSTKYYRFHHRAVGNTWQFRHDASVVSYYLNFM